MKEQTMKSMSQDAEMNKYRAESDLRTLQDAKTIEKDPKRMKACMALAKQKLAAMHEMMGGDEKMKKGMAGKKHAGMK
jgi:hypothetical protein